MNGDYETDFFLDNVYFAFIFNSDECVCVVGKCDV